VQYFWKEALLYPRVQAQVACHRIAAVSIAPETSGAGETRRIRHDSCVCQPREPWEACMATPDNVKEWWTQTLLNQAASAHPIFGRDLQAQVEGDVITLTGQVESVEQLEEIEAEARSIDYVHHVVNNLVVAPQYDAPYHMQTVIGVFDDLEAAELTCREVISAQIHAMSKPTILQTGEEAERYLRQCTTAAQTGEDGLKHFLKVLSDGKVLVADRVPEDDALRIISALEGSLATGIETLPPEPESLEEV